MERAYGQVNLDYASGNQQQNGYDYRDDPKSGYQHPQAVSSQLYNAELSEKEEDDAPYSGSGNQSSFGRIGLHILRLVFTITLIGLILAIPIFITMQQAYDLSFNNHTQNRNFVFWFFVWMEATFVAGAAANVFALIFPYVFYAVAKWVNPAHRRCKLPCFKRGDSRGD